jgi:flavin reductase
MIEEFEHDGARARFHARELRRALGAFTTGVTVITTRVAGCAHGMTANAFSSVSLEPPLVLVCIKSGGLACRDVAASGRFAVNILSAQQEALSARFASRERPHGPYAFRDVPHWVAASGAPILEGVAAYLDCRTVASHEAGDHRIFIAEVTDLGAEPDAPPLLFHRGRYARMA